MYVPSHFQESRPEILHDLITRNPFGMLVTHGGNGLDANHLPFELEPASGPFGTLHAHFARANPLRRDVQNGEEVLVVFRAEHAYISPNWYPTKHETPKQVPTWNYMVVHAHGKVALRDDEQYVRDVVTRLTQRHEASQAQPWKISDSPKTYIDAMLKAIIGVEIRIERLVGKFKLSQNRETRDIVSVGQTLIERGNVGLGQSMLDCGACYRPKA